jgi:hypothetical protein
MEKARESLLRGVYQALWLVLGQRYFLCLGLWVQATESPHHEINHTPDSPARLFLLF